MTQSAAWHIFRLSRGLEDSIAGCFVARECDLHSLRVPIKSGLHLLSHQRNSSFKIRRLQGAGNSVKRVLWESLEPTGNLDSRTSVEIMEIFQNLNDKGFTIVLVTHEHDIAQFAKRVLVFRDGKIRKDEPVLNRPQGAEVLKTLPTLED